MTITVRAILTATATRITTSATKKNPETTIKKLKNTIITFTKIRTFTNIPIYQLQTIVVLLKINNNDSKVRIDGTW